MAFSVLNKPVTFIAKDGAIDIRMTDSMVASVYSAARTLKARYVVATFDWSDKCGCPIWSVYDVQKASTRVSSSGDMALPLPERVFVDEKNDGAVMFAMALLGGGK